MDQHDPKHPPETPNEFTDLNVTPPLNDIHQLVRYLHANGHFNPRDQNNLSYTQVPLEDVLALTADHPRFEAAIASWQSFRPNGPQHRRFDEQCHAIAEQEAEFRCALPDVIPRPTRGSRWPDQCKHDLTTSHQLHNLKYSADPNQTIDTAWYKGLELWNHAADLTLSMIQTREAAKLMATAQRLGGNILAWSHLANGSCLSKLKQRYNSAVNWRWHLLWTTICHEVGHFLGIGHGGRGIMTPAYDRNVDLLDQWDRNQVISRYGQAQPTPPPPTPEPSPFHHARIQLYDAAGVPIRAYDLTPDP